MSEFGKGLVICLVKFAEHRWRWGEQKRQYEKMRGKDPDGFSISEAVIRHFNGASDHLFEIEVPLAWKDTEIDKKVSELQTFGLEMGHGFTKKVWTEEDVEKAYTVCQDIAVLIDKALNLDPERGEW